MYGSCWIENDGHQQFIHTHRHTQPELSASQWPQAESASTAAGAAACSLGDSGVGTVTDGAAASTASAGGASVSGWLSRGGWPSRGGWLSRGGCSGSAVGRVFGADNAVDDGWNLPKSSLIKEKPANSSWLMALMMAGSTGVSVGSSEVKSLSKLAVSVRDFYNTLRCTCKYT